MDKPIKLLLFISTLIILSCFVFVNAASAASLNVVPFTLGKMGSATAEWLTAQANSGSYSVHLKTTASAGDYAYMLFDPLPATIDNITSLSFYYYHVSYNTWPGPRILIGINDSGNYYLAVSGTASSSIGLWKKANGITGGNLTTYDPNPTKVWWYGTCSDALCSSYSQVGGPVNFSTIQSLLDGDIVNVLVYMGVVDGVNVGDGEAYVDDVEVNSVVYYGRIQDAVDAASVGNTINVAAGTYTEQITISKNLALVGAGKAVTTVKAPASMTTVSVRGGTQSIQGVINVKNVSAQTINVNIKGFTINGDYVAPAGSSTWFAGIVYSNANGTIEENNITKIRQATLTDGSASWRGHGIWVGDASNVTIKNNIISDYQRNGIEIRDPAATATVINNTITCIESAYTVANGVTFYGATNGIITGNTATGCRYTGLGSGNDFYGGTQSAGILVYNSYGTFFISDNTVMNNDIGIYSRVLSFANITDNTVENNLYFGIVFRMGDITTTYNTITDSEIGIFVPYTRPASALTPTAHFNEIYSNTVYGVKNDAAYLTNATHNWWGSYDGPGYVGLGNGDNVSSNVDYTPWIGFNITNQSVTPKKLFNYSDAWLNATINVTLPYVCALDDVWIMGNWTGTWTNYTNVVNTGSYYYYLVDSSFLDNGETVLWRYYANDSCGHLGKGAWQNFTVTKRTELTIIPFAPDGNNGWYITAPWFTLTPDAGRTAFYRWDSEANIMYTVPFNLLGIPGGIEMLHYFSNDSSNNLESDQQILVKVDVTPPRITSLIPANNSIMSISDITISAELDEIYQANSGINKPSIIMKVDDVIVTPVITDLDTINAMVSYSDSFSDGLHDVSVNVSDNAGHNSYLLWYFTVDTSTPLLMSTSSPKNTTYGGRRIPFNISLNKNVSLLEYSLDGGRFQRLCEDCDSYYKFKSFSNGWHNLTFRAVSFGEQVNDSFVFLIDTKAPRIKKTLPKHNSYVSGTNFTVFYNEDYTKEVILHYREIGGSYTNELLTGCVNGTNQQCSKIVDLSAYDGLQVEYYFAVSDNVHTTDSRVSIINVDSTSPTVDIISPVDEEEYLTRRINIAVDVSEPVTLMKSVDGGSFRTLCRRCDFVNKSAYFSLGDYALTIRAVDYAGNVGEETVGFSVTS